MYKGTIAMRRSTLGYVLSRSKVPIEGEPGHAPGINWVSKHGDFRRRSKRWFLFVLLAAVAAGIAFPAMAQVELDILNLFKEVVQEEGPQSDPPIARDKRNLDVGAVALVEEIRDSPRAGIQTGLATTSLLPSSRTRNTLKPIRRVSDVVSQVISMPSPGRPHGFPARGFGDAR